MPHQPPTPGLPRTARCVIWFLAAAIIAMLGLHVVNQVLTDRAAEAQVVRYDVPTFRLRYRMLNVDREMSLPTWFSTVLLSANAALMLFLAWAHRRRREPGGWGWALLGTVFFLLSLDEATSIHDTAANYLRADLPDDAPGFLYAGWTIVAMPLVGLLFLVLLPWLWRRPAWLRWRLVVAGGLFLTGAVGFETVMVMLYRSVGGDPPLQGGGGVPMLLVMAEEGLEMGSMLWVAHMLLRHAAEKIVLSVHPLH